jgi:hypothetical protein
MERLAAVPAPVERLRLVCETSIAVDAESPVYRVVGFSPSADGLAAIGCAVSGPVILHVVQNDSNARRRHVLEQAR